MIEFPKMALSVRQPWAWLIFHGKDVENRNWRTRFRGRVAIHAAMGMTAIEYEDAVRFVRRFDAQLAAVIPKRGDLVRGAILGDTEITDCADFWESPWFVGAYGFTLRGPRPIEPVPCRGQLGFFAHGIDPGVVRWR